MASDNSVVVVGGGIAGIQSSLDLADRGYTVYLVEKSPSIGGKMALLDKTFPTMDCAICILAPKMIEVLRHPNIKLLSYSEIEDVNGPAGDLTVKVLRKRRYVDEEKCTGCNNCADVCTVSIPDEYNEGLSERKAAYRPFPQAIPNVFALDKRGLAPCRTACPGGVNAQGYVALIRDGKYEEAIELVREAIPFPTVCGKVCFHPCESECERSNVDEPIAIKALKRFVSDHEAQNELQKPEPIPRQFDEKVAIVGSGPAGLTAAYELVKRGYHATVFESLPEPGGMLRYAIPSYRLPKEDLNREIQWMVDQGVEIVTNKTVGKDLTLKELTHSGPRPSTDLIVTVGRRGPVVHIGKGGENLRRNPASIVTGKIHACRPFVPVKRGRLGHAVHLTQVLWSCQGRLYLNREVKLNEISTHHGARHRPRCLAGLLLRQTRADRAGPLR